jgi:hypothetical protein
MFSQPGTTFEPHPRWSRSNGGADAKDPRVACAPLACPVEGRCCREGTLATPGRGRPAGAGGSLGENGLQTGNLV